MKILITGVAGFIGFSLSKYLLNKKHNVIGIDNLNSYYNQKLKIERINNLKCKNFFFIKEDISNKENIFKKLKKYKFDIIIHLAAQPGVRYSLKNPYSYIKNNLDVFGVILEYARIKKVKLIYASSSSVYGDSKNFPLKENYKLNPKNIYAVTKKNNEELAEIYSKQFDLSIVGIRFFTVYGEWGRPDMFLIKFFEYMKKGKVFPLYNNGNHFRDFTYINDLLKMLYPLIKDNNKLIKKEHILYNICSGKSKNIKTIIKFLIKITGYNKIKYLSYLNTEVKKTHGSNKKLIKKINIKIIPTKFQDSVRKTYEWFNLNKNLF